MACHNYAIHANDVPSIDGVTPGGCAAAVMVHEQVIAHGHASSSRYAKIRASVAALDELRYLAPFEFRIKYQCDCMSKARAAGKEELGDNVTHDAVEDSIGTAI